MEISSFFRIFSWAEFSPGWVSVYQQCIKVVTPHTNHQFSSLLPRLVRFAGLTLKSWLIKVFYNPAHNPPHPKPQPQLQLQTTNTTTPVPPPPINPPHSTLHIPHSTQQLLPLQHTHTHKKVDYQSQ